MQKEFYIDIEIYGYSRKKLRKVLAEVAKLLHLTGENLFCVPHTREWTESTLTYTLLPNSEVVLTDVNAMLAMYQLTFVHAYRSERKPIFSIVKFRGSNAVRMVKLECFGDAIVEYFNSR